MTEYFRDLSAGWRCPGCNRCFAPSVSECAYCNATAYLGVNGNVRVFAKLCFEHDFGPPDSAGQAWCRNCFAPNPNPIEVVPGTTISGGTT